MDLEIVATVVRLAHILGPVTAESIETDTQLTRLRRLGCDTGQGWYFSPAVPPEDIPGLRPPGPSSTHRHHRVTTSRLTGDTPPGTDPHPTTPTVPDGPNSRNAQGKRRSRDCRCE